MTSLPTFEELVLLASPPKGTLVALDPGNTTGVATFKNGVFHSGEEIDTSTIEKGIDNLLPLIQDAQHIVYESYRVYKWKAQDHVHNDLHTSQLIGCIRTLSYLNLISCTSQTAQVAKQFVTDEKLKTWNLWIKGRKHARDAIRHGCYYLLFNAS